MADLTWPNLSHKKLTRPDQGQKFLTQTHHYKDFSIEFSKKTKIVFQLVLNGKIFLGLRRVQRNLRRHRTITQSARSRSAILASKLSTADGEF